MVHCVLEHGAGLNVPPAVMLLKLADVLSITVDYLLTGNPVEETPLGQARRFQRFQAVERFEVDDQEAVINLSDGMIAKQHMKSTLKSLVG